MKTTTTKTMTVIGILALALGAVCGQAQLRVSVETREDKLARARMSMAIEDSRDPLGAALRKERLAEHFKNTERMGKALDAQVKAQIAAAKTNAANAAVRRQQYAEEQREKRAQAALENQPKREAWLAARAERKAEAAKLP
jgi:hypothetical protein